ncbi:MFS transporter [Uliginosibacterium sp. H3]|uniref:MFS transporter n=1 Tax=Uliginosibacterium silvisoli TaxID=3114758 RepID=A0ABU6JZ37_9RHOO|nr:MFS transporter [Uliginosibacterium sp. H3]
MSRTSPMSATPAADTPESDRMSALEWRVGGSLAAIFGLRMLGLFLVLPVFSVFASGLPGGDNFQLVSLAFGAFMLVQAFLYLPFGLASDRFGRKPVIVFGLLLFAAGSVMAAWAPTIYWMIAARAVQGMGAVSAAVTALASDLTREQHRTKIMAMIGSTIGLAFSLSLVVSPLLYAWIGMRGMFLAIALLALLAIPLLLRVVPDPAHAPVQRERVPLLGVLKDTQLLRLNFGIFALHVLQTAMFLVVPHQLIERHGLALGQHWHVYLPVVLGSFVVAIPAIMQSERKGRTKQMFIASIGMLLVSQAGLWLGMESLLNVVVMLLLFFAAFNILEASLPALVSRIAPTRAKGTALGIFNTTQALGVAAGSAFGGWIAVHLGPDWINVMTVTLVFAWGLIALSMKVPARLTVKTVALGPDANIELMRERIASLPGVREVAMERERGIATLKINPERWDESRLQRLIGGEA